MTHENMYVFTYIDVTWLKVALCIFHCTSLLRWSLESSPNYYLPTKYQLILLNNRGILKDDGMTLHA